MEIKILESWLKDCLDTKASSKEFAKYLSLSGPTVDRTHKFGKNDKVFEIEVTSNRVDAMSVYGIAREASAVLPRYDIKAKLKSLPVYGDELPKKGEPLTLKPDPKLTYRLMGVVLDNIKEWQTPQWMKERLESADMRSLNSVVDITNYVMHEVGHPCHVFDYDKIPNKKIVVRESKKGEKITSFDGKKYTLSGGDIVFDDGDGNIIDLPGIIGTKNSVVTKETKRVLFFLDTNSAKHIRKTSMELAIRTNAAVLNEKGVDPERAEVAMLRGLQLFREVCGAEIVSPIYDSYPVKPDKVSIKIEKSFITKILDIDIDNSEIEKILKSLGFSLTIKSDVFDVNVPSFRSNDVLNKESIVEEIARIYGYHNLPSKIMDTKLPTFSTDKTFNDEMKIRETLVRLGAMEVYTFSLVSKDMAGENALKLINPLGSDTEYLRTSLRPSLQIAAEENKAQQSFHLFEISNVYKKVKSGLPNEILTLAGIFKGYDYLDAKGVLETFFEKLNIEYKSEIDDNKMYVNDSSIKFLSGKDEIASFGLLKNGYIYYETKVSVIRKLMKDYPRFKPIPEFPPQIEDVTVEIKGKPVGEVYEYLKSAHKKISNVELVDIYEDSYTFRIFYQDPKKTLTDDEVQDIREEVLKGIKSY